MGSDNTFRRVARWVGVSAIVGYAALFSNYQTDNYLMNSKSDSSPSNSSPEIEHVTKSFSMSIDSSSAPKKYSSDSLENRVGTADLDHSLEPLDMNNRYLTDHSEDILIYPVTGLSFLTKKISSTLAKTKHIHRKHKLAIPEIDYLRNDLSSRELLRIYFMLEALKRPSFRDNIGAMISRDIADKYAEHGGYMDFDENNLLRLNEVPTNFPRTLENDEAYGFSVDDTIPFIAIYHFHASAYDESDFAGPGSSDMLSGFDEAQEFVITSLSKGKFNVDFYGNVASKNDTSYKLDLGVYSYH